MCISLLEIVSNIAGCCYTGVQVLNCLFTPVIHC
jgi:hypothetical protein